MTDVTPLAPARFAEAVGVFARSFVLAPGTVFVYPEEVRLARITAFFRVMVNGFGEAGVVVATPGLESVGLLVPPGAAGVDDALATAGIGDFVGGLPPDEAERFRRLVGTLTAQHEAVAPGPHWKLSFLGTEPDQQGKGHGVAIVDDITSRAARDAVPAFLDTLTAANAAFYGRHGFAVVAEVDVPDSTVHAWTMRHQPLGVS